MMHTRFPPIPERTPSIPLTPTLVVRAGRLVRRAWQAYWRWQARRAAVQILYALDSRTLHDIGISRSEIESVVYGREGHRTRSYDETWRWHAGS